MNHILVIEDEPLVLFSVKELLELEGFNVDTAEDGEIGLRKALDDNPDLIICDLNMPNMDGYQVLENIRKNPKTESTPFIFLTARSDKKDIRKGMELGAEDYLTKPFKQNELYIAVQTQLKKKEFLKSKTDKLVSDIKQKIISILPHELRTPLNGILGCTKILQQDYKNLNENEIDEMLDVIMTSAKRLNRLVVNYLLYSQMLVSLKSVEELEEYRNQRIEFSNEAILQLAMDTARLYNRTGDIIVRITPITKSLKVIDNLLVKSIEELLDNAFKFSDKGTKVELFNTIDEDGVHFHIKDTGVGFKEESLSKVDAYIQFDRNKMEQQGSGMGLVIVKMITEMFKGNLSIKTIDKNTEAVVTFLLI